jgi:NTP pyrophosphatase (non-canonical NTP hydrolase)
MNFNEYQKLAFRTCKQSSTKEELQMNAVLGLNGEVGEIADIYKKGNFQGHKISEDDVKKELGDILWYIALMATALEVDLEDIAEMNIDKLRRRYPEGFSEEKSINREG